MEQQEAETQGGGAGSVRALRPRPGVGQEAPPVGGPVQQASTFWGRGDDAGVPRARLAGRIDRFLLLRRVHDGSRHCKSHPRFKP